MTAAQRGRESRRKPEATAVRMVDPAEQRSNTARLATPKRMRKRGKHSTDPAVATDNVETLRPPDPSVGDDTSEADEWEGTHHELLGEDGKPFTYTPAILDRSREILSAKKWMPGHYQTAETKASLAKRYVKPQTPPSGRYGAAYGHGQGQSQTPPPPHGRESSPRRAKTPPRPSHGSSSTAPASVKRRVEHAKTKGGGSKAGAGHREAEGHGAHRKPPPSSPADGDADGRQVEHEHEIPRQADTSLLSPGE